MATENSYQADVIRERLSFVIVFMLLGVIVLILRIISFQFPQDPRVVAEFSASRDANAGRTERVESDRGRIFDRDGNPLAVNTRQFRIGISPALVSNPARVAAQLAVILNTDELELFELLRSDRNWVPLGTVDPNVWQEIRDLELFAIDVTRVQKRYYPQGTLGSQVVGFVFGIGEDAQGAYGVEGYYHNDLAGSVRDREVSNIPFELPEDVSGLGQGADLVLTIDRDIQFLAESELQRAISETGAEGGTIIIMDPRYGDILAMASYPPFDPNAYFDVSNPRDLGNPAISDVYEPGSVFKVLTVAAGLESGAITPGWTYYDNGQYDIGGIRIQNWDRQAHGEVDVTSVLVNSLNVGVAHIAQEMGWENFYGMLDQFGIGSLTRVDLEGEEEGILRTPDDLSGEWSESDLGTNSFGQGVSVTSLQMLTAVNAIANGGVMMQPRIVHQKIEGDVIYESPPKSLRRVISEETARLVTEMMVAVVEGNVDSAARVQGYTIAGKTGTAEIWDVVGYLPDEFVMSFVGFLPADDPQVSVLIKLDRPDLSAGRWASQVVAPIFSRLTSRLVVLLEIPTDDVRHALINSNTDVNIN